MKDSLKTGVTFGVTSGVITSLGLMVGLHSGTQSKLAVVGGIVIIAVADAFSDAFGIHISEESKNDGTALEVWESTAATFFAKCLVALTFAVPVLWLDLDVAIVVSALWGLSLLAALSYVLARTQRAPAWKVIGEHVGIGVAVIAITHYLGVWVRRTFE
ncbi:membrane protein [Nitrospira sp.]|nr:membrane protein [Nitrospira sp.]